MDKTFAGANKCSPKNHDRPFVIEWDATDMSSFEAKAANDVVFVTYEGCDMKVLDACSNDSIKGSLGAYGAVEWTSGSVEKLDISDEGELYAKLPLGAGSLGGRVQAGEQFHMEYYVSGTRKATRDAVFTRDLDKIPGCKGATHFVYGYNLGAFALGSKKEIKGEAGGTVWGIGAGGSRKSMNNAEKKGGALTSCTGETAKETMTCKVPIRLTLREISSGENPDQVAARAPETPDALNLAGKIDTKLKQDAKAQARWDAAIDRFKAGDGKACLKELDARDKLDKNATNLSTNPKSATATYRSWCLMLAGQCNVGKAQFRRSLQAQMSALDASPEVIDRFVEQQASQLCQGGAMSPRDQLLKASNTLQVGASNTKDAATCASAYATVKRLSQTVKPKGDDDYAVTSAVNINIAGHSAALCLGRAGDCGGAFNAYKESKTGGDSPTQMDEASLRKAFASTVTQCKGHFSAMPTTPREQLISAYDDLVQGSARKTDPAICAKSYATVMRLTPIVQPNDATDSQVLGITTTVTRMPANLKSSLAYCLGKGGDCEGARRAFQEGFDVTYASLPEVQRKQVFSAQKQVFESQAPNCKK